jgi:hypothetical protein
VAYTSFVLAKQAGFDFQFQKAGQELKDAPLYLLPSLKSIDPFYKDYWFKLLDKVKAGATLYMSLDDAYLPTFNEPLGIEVLSNIKRRGRVSFNAKLGNDSVFFSANSERKIAINPLNTTVLAKEADGNPVFFKTSYGKGFIYLLTFPLEHNLTNTTGAFDKGQPSYANIYKEIASPFIKERVITQNSPFIGVTEHSLSNNEKAIVLINYSTEDLTIEPVIKQGWKIVKSFYGDYSAEKSVTIKANDALVLSVQQKK